jgi:hypothetical protein
MLPVPILGYFGKAWNLFSEAYFDFKTQLNIVTFLLKQSIYFRLEMDRAH